MIHPHTELVFITERVGYGVVATRFIPRGTITWVQDTFDQVFAAERASMLEGVHRELLAKYGYKDVNGDMILCWDHARFVNHSCDPSCLSPGYNFEISVRDIQPGEQLTDDYATLNLDDPFECYCGMASCRGVVRPADPSHLADGWDGSLADSFPLILSVKQPLWDLVQERDVIQNVISGGAALASCRVNFVGV